MSEQIVLRCEDSLEGIFTALFDAFVCKNKMKAPYTDSISIAAGEGEMTLFARRSKYRQMRRKCRRRFTVYSRDWGIRCMIHCFMHYAILQRIGGQQFLDIWCVHLHRDVVFPISLPIRLHFG